MSAPAREMAEEDTKAAAKPKFVTLKVLDQEDRRIRHTIRMTDTVQAVMDMYYEKVGDVDYGTGVFMLDGIRLQGCKTPADLEMEDGDLIEFFPETPTRKAAAKPKFITLKVLDQDDRLIRHTIRMTDKLQAVMDMYYEKVDDVDYGTGVFMLDGIRLRGCKTPADLEMEDGDEIEFFSDQEGGGCDYASLMSA